MKKNIIFLIYISTFIVVSCGQNTPDVNVNLPEQNIPTTNQNSSDGFKKATISDDSSFEATEVPEDDVMSGETATVTSFSGTTETSEEKSVSNSLSSSQ